MADKLLKRYLFASDFDQTLTFNDSGYVLSELVGIPTAEFERKAKGMAKLNLVQQGAELAYLLLHDPEFRSRVRREHLYQVGKIIRLKENIELLSKILESGIEGYQFDFYVLSAAPVEVIQAALEGMLPADHIYGTEFRYNAEGGIESVVRATAGYGKVAVLDNLQAKLQVGPDQIVYTGDGSSDVHVMLHVNVRDGFTIAVSEAKHVAHVAKRAVLSTNALAVLAPILEDIVGWGRVRIREFFEAYGLLVQEWDRVRLDRAVQSGQVDAGAWQAEIQQIFEQEIAVHFEAEERELFPAAASRPELRSLVEELLDEHEALRQVFACAATRRLTSDDLRSFAARLSTHIRKEERDLFERMQKVLSLVELAAIGKALEAALANSSQSCIIPGEATRLRPKASGS